MKKVTKIWLGLIFVIVLTLRLYIAFQTPEMNLEAYSVLRQVEHITDTGLPLFSDDLSYRGRTFIFSPVYHYVLAFFNLFLPIHSVLKIIPNLFASMLIFVIFLLSNYMVKDEKIALLSTVFSGFIPVFFVATINNASIFTALIPLFFLTTYYFLQTNKNPKYLNKLLISMVVLTFLDPTSIILALSFLVYIGLIKVQQFRESSREPELVLFFIFLVFWVNMVIYKNALVLHGLSVITQNMPKALIDASYSQITFLQSIFGIGVIPLLFGLVSIYMSLFNSRKKTVTLMMSISLVIFILLLLRLIELNVGLMFLGVALCVLATYTFHVTYILSRSTKFKLAPKLFFIISIVVLILTGIPLLAVSNVVAKDVPSQEEITAYLWIKNNTKEDSVVLTLPREGSLMSYYSQRKNVADDNFLLINNVNTLYKDITFTYRSKFLTSALENLNYYSVDYIVLTQRNKKMQNITKLDYEGDCVSLIDEFKDTQTKVFKVNCVYNSN